jgi:hypothetical protein
VQCVQHQLRVSSAKHKAVLKIPHSTYGSIVTCVLLPAIAAHSVHAHAGLTWGPHLVALAV